MAEKGCVVMQSLLDNMGWVPRTCVWEITRACNLHCGHCGSMAGSPRRDELSTAECRGVIDELAQLGNQLITLSGGEPTLRRDWPELASYAIDRGIAVNLVTNGQVDGKLLAEQAHRARLANVAVSLDGLESTHDALRTRGAFRRASATIESLSMAGLWVDVMVTINRRNLPELDELHQYAAKLGAKRFRVQLGKPMGNQTHRADLTLAPKQLLELLPTLGQLDKKRRLPVLLGDSVGYFSAAERRLRSAHCDQEHWTGCYAGCQAIGIQSDGSIKGCLSLQPRAGEQDPFIEGNVRREPLRDIWLDPRRFSYNRAPQHPLSGACGQCSHRTLCRGGAKCVAYSFTGTFEQDPMCYLAVSRSAPSLRIWPTAAAAMLLGAAIPGCSGEVSPSPGNTGGAGGSTAVTGGATATTGGQANGGTTNAGGTAATGGKSSGGTAGTSSIDCSTVCCMCDYGIIPPDKYAACCTS